MTDVEIEIQSFQQQVERSLALLKTAASEDSSLKEFRITLSSLLLQTKSKSDLKDAISFYENVLATLQDPVKNKKVVESFASDFRNYSYN